MQFETDTCFLKQVISNSSGISKIDSFYNSGDYCYFVKKKKEEKKMKKKRMKDKQQLLTGMCVLV